MVTGNNAIDRDPFAMTRRIDALAYIESRTDFLYRAAQCVAALTREDGAEGVDSHQHGDDFVVNTARAGQRAMHRGEECADDADEEKLLEDNSPAAQRVPRLAQNGQPGEKEDAERGECERTVNDPVRCAGDRRQIDREAENHGLRGEEPGHADAQPSFGFAVEHELIGRLLASCRVVTAGGHWINLICPIPIRQCVAIPTRRAVGRSFAFGQHIAHCFRGAVVQPNPQGYAPRQENHRIQPSLLPPFQRNAGSLSHLGHRSSPIMTIRPVLRRPSLLCVQERLMPAKCDQL